MKLISVSAGILLVGLACTGGTQEPARNALGPSSKDVVAPWSEMDLPIYGGVVARSSPASFVVVYLDLCDEAVARKRASRYAAALKAKGWKRVAEESLWPTEYTVFFDRDNGRGTLAVRPTASTCEVQIVTDGG